VPETTSSRIIDKKVSMPSTPGPAASTRAANISMRAFMKRRRILANNSSSVPKVRYRLGL